MKVLSRRLSSEAIPSGLELEPLLEVYVNQLETIARQGEPRTSGWFLSQSSGSDNRKMARLVGEEVNKEYGFDGMKYVCARIADRLGSGPARELDCAWDWIGRWLG